MLVNERGKVMEVDGGADRENSNIAVGDAHANTIRQQFKIVYLDEVPAAPKRGDYNKDWGLKIGEPFFLQTSLPSGRYLDMIGRNMVIKTRNRYTSQMWYFDWRSKTIKSWKNKGWSWDIQNAGRSTNMQAWNTNSGWF